MSHTGGKFFREYPRRDEHRSSAGPRLRLAKRATKGRPYGETPVCAVGAAALGSPFVCPAPGSTGGHKARPYGGDDTRS